MQKLFFKEIREKRLLLVFALVLSLVSPVTTLVLYLASLVPGSALLNISRGISLIFYFFLTVTFPILVGSSAFSGEVEKGNLEFLLSLPASRWKVWLTKAVAGLSLVYGMVAVFIAVNQPLSGMFSLPTGYMAAANIWFIPVSLLFPALVLAIAMASSTVFNSETASSASAFLGVILWFWLLIHMVGKFIWDIIPFEIAVLILISAVALFFLSFGVFYRGENMKLVIPRIKTALILLILSLGLFYASAYLMFQKSVRFGPGDVRSSETVGMVDNNRKLLLQVWCNDPRLKSKNPDDSPISQDSRLFLMDAENKDISEIPVRFVKEVSISPDGGKVAIFCKYMGYRSLRTFTGGIEESAHLYDVDTGKTITLYDSSTDPSGSDTAKTRNKNTRIRWLGSESLVFVTEKTDLKGNTVLYAAAIYDSTGELLDLVDVRNDKKRKTRMQIAGKNIYVLEGTKPVFHGEHYDTEDLPGKVEHIPGEGSKAVVRRYNRENRKMDVVFERVSSENVQLYIPSLAVSADEKFITLFENDVENQTTRVIIYHVDTGKEVSVEGFDSEVITPGAAWLQVSNLLGLLRRDDPKICMFVDPAMGKASLSRLYYNAYFGAENPYTGEIGYLESDEEGSGNILLKVQDPVTGSIKLELEMGKQSNSRSRILFWIDRDNLAVLKGRTVLKVNRDGSMTTLPSLP